MMHTFILVSDIHANARAFRAVLEHTSNHYPEVPMVCLGDIVGYGSDPVSALDLVNGHVRDDSCIGGNHDYGLVGMPGFDKERYNASAQAALKKHNSLLDSTRKSFLSRLPKFAQTDDVLFCHGSPLDTNHYITDEFDILRCLSSPRIMERKVICFGHTHIPSISAVRDGKARMFYPFRPRTELDAEVNFGDEDLVFINPGSVGQPRDGVAGACYAYVDTVKKFAHWHRCGYDIAAEREDIIALGLPAGLGDRLMRGM